MGRHRLTDDKYMGMTTGERLAARLVRMPNGCLEWTGGTNPTGYGKISVAGRDMRTHRLAWELAHGPIPPDMKVLHHCDNPPCCEPYGVDHLFLGTDADNAADRTAKGRGSNGNVGKTHCPADHKYTEANTYVNKHGHRFCRACGRAAQIRYQTKKKVQL